MELFNIDASLTCRGRCIGGGRQQGNAGCGVRGGFQRPRACSEAEPLVLDGAMSMPRFLKTRLRSSGECMSPRDTAEYSTHWYREAQTSWVDLDALFSARSSAEALAKPSLGRARRSSGARVIVPPSMRVGSRASEKPVDDPHCARKRLKLYSPASSSTPERCRLLPLEVDVLWPIRPTPRRICHALARRKRRVAGGEAPQQDEPGSC